MSSRQLNRHRWTRITGKFTVAFWHSQARVGRYHHEPQQLLEELNDHAIGKLPGVAALSRNRCRSWSNAQPPPGQEFALSSAPRRQATTGAASSLSHSYPWYDVVESEKVFAPLDGPVAYEPLTEDEPPVDAVWIDQTPGLLSNGLAIRK